MNILAYHGTSSEIEQFDPAFTGHGNDQYGSGFYFTTDESIALGYATEPRRDAITGQMIADPDMVPMILSANITLQNPLCLSGKEFSNLSAIVPTLSQTRQIIKALPSLYLSAEDENILGDYFEEFWEPGCNRDRLIDRLAKEYFHPTDLRMLDNLFSKYPTEFRNAVRNNMGYDGVIVQFDDSEHIIAWFPEQIELLSKEAVYEQEEEYELCM